MRYKSLLWKLYFLLYSFPSIEWSDRRRYFSIPRGVHNYRAQGKNVLIKRNKIIPKENPDKLSLFLVGLCNSVIKLVSSSYFQEFCQSLWRTPNQKYKQNSTARTSLKTMNWCWRKNFPNISRWDKLSTLSLDQINENLLPQIIEDIVDTVDGQSLTKSSDFTGFKKFLLGCLEALDIDISRFMGTFIRDLVCDLTLIL